MEEYKKTKKILKGIVIGVAFGTLLVWPVFLEFENYGIKHNISVLSGGHGGDWLQFWGSYIGIIFSGLLALFISFRENKNNFVREKNNRTIGFYVADLREISYGLVPLEVDKGFISFYSQQLELSKEDVERLQLMFFSFDGKRYQMKEIPTIGKIVGRMPAGRRKIFEPIVREIDSNLLTLIQFDPNFFRNDEDQKKGGTDEASLRESKQFLGFLITAVKGIVHLNNEISLELLKYSTLD
ncbi:hypothetical protein [Leuconostoc pseudomesenteroides]|uniref:hypothetical protein n=1 Tax=Leuconostoc pseudomesenteroides TaxID=33968 RepID=UPI00289E741D|nr:hypothetical protein [Leuconostoc pseudomesenteroides]